MLKKEANKITGGLSAPGKMPEGSYNLPARACITGAKLREIPGTPCRGCYAFKGRYNFPNVKDALSRRLESLQDPQWIEAMTVLIKGKKFLDGTTPETSRAPGTSKIYSKSASSHRRRCTGCQLKSANFCHYLKIVFQKI